MYNLFVSGNEESWNGEPWTVEVSRCVREYTDDDIINQFGNLNETAIKALQQLPCVFAYESARNLGPKFGVIREILKRQGQVRVVYEIIPIEPFLSVANLGHLMLELDIGRWELNRTHWAVKNINLAKELHSIGIILPSWARSLTKSVDISTHEFDVALSFPGEARPLVHEIAGHLEGLIGPNAYFYDNNYVSKLARPALDILLQDIYLNRSKLVVVFISADYQRKDWCGIEFRAIRNIIAEREHNRVMFIRTDDGVVEGVFATDGYIDARIHDSTSLARFIQERSELL